jgi:hypothetical protein
MPGVDRNQIIKIVAIVLAVLGVLGLCSGVLLVAGGALGGVGLGLGAAAVQESGSTDPEVQQALSAGAAASGFALILGVANIILGPIMLVAAYGLFQKKSWARMLTVIAAGLSAVVNLAFILTGGGLLGNLIPLVIDAFVAYLFYTDAEIQRILSN